MFSNRQSPLVISHGLWSLLFLGVHYEMNHTLIYAFFQTESFVDLAGSKEHSWAQIIWLLTVACLVALSAKWFLFVSMLVALECPGILIISNCLGRCMSSNNSATCFPFFMDCPEVVKEPRCFHNIVKSSATPKAQQLFSVNINCLIFGQWESLS